MKRRVFVIDCNEVWSDHERLWLRLLTFYFNQCTEIRLQSTNSGQLQVRELKEKDVMIEGIKYNYWLWEIEKLGFSIELLNKIYIWNTLLGNRKKAFPPSEFYLWISLSQSQLLSKVLKRITKIKTKVHRRWSSRKMSNDHPDYHFVHIRPSKASFKSSYGVCKTELTNIYHLSISKLASSIKNIVINKNHKWHVTTLFDEILAFR